jgi:hypothetical protein
VALAGARVIVFMGREEWARDVSREFALELQRLADSGRRELTKTVRDFVACYSQRSLT